MRCVVFGVLWYKPTSTPETPFEYTFANGKRTTKKAIVSVAIALAVAILF